MNIPQQDAAKTHATGFALKLISVSALALMLGISAAVSQTNNEPRKHEAEKQKDNELLTPVRPLPRKVDESSWPTPNPDAQKAAEERKTAPPTRETTGQASNQQQPAQNNAQQSNPQPQQSAQPQQPAQQQPATAQNNPPQNAQPPQQQPATAQTKPAQQQAQPQPPAQKAQSNQPQPAPTAQNNQPPAQNNQPQPQQPATAQNNQPPAQNAQQAKQQSYASIRLGTDAGGKVAVNTDQQRQLAKALGKQRVQPVELSVAVQVGGPPPQDVRLSAVTSDMVDVLPQFRGYSYFATANEVYIVDPAASRVVAFFPVKLTATASRPAPAQGRTGPAPAPETTASAPAPETTASAPAQPATAAAPPPTASAPAQPTRRTTRAPRRGDDLAGIESAVEREMIRKGLMPRNATGSATTRTVVIEDDVPVRVYRTPRWQPWYGGGRRVYELED